MELFRLLQNIKLYHNKYYIKKIQNCHDMKNRTVLSVNISLRRNILHGFQLCSTLTKMNVVDWTLTLTLKFILIGDTAKLEKVKTITLRIGTQLLLVCYISEEAEGKFDTLWYSQFPKHSRHMLYYFGEVRYVEIN